MKLVLNYFKPKNIQRFGEYLVCLEENINNNLIDEIYLFVSDDSTLSLSHEKIKIIKFDQRPSLMDMFEFCNTKLAGELCIIASSDIIFDETLAHANTDIGNLLLMITRWDYGINESEIVLTRFDNIVSQDVYIFKSPVKVTTEMAECYLGVAGSDNRIARLFHDLGYDISNPQHLIVTKHLHLTKYRTYKESTRVPGPYLQIEPVESLIKSPVEKFNGFDGHGCPY